MDIERLTARDKEGIAYLVNVKPDEQEVSSPHKNTLKCILDCFEKLAQYEEAEIAHQSVKSEEVQEAIEWQVSLKGYHQNKWEKAEPEWQQEPGAQAQHNEMIMAIDLAITALQAYQPWVPCSERMPKESDADKNGHILAYSVGLQRSTICLWYHIIGDNTTTHWRRNIEPPKGE